MALKSSVHGEHVIVSQEAQDELVEDIQGFLRQAYAIGQRHGQAMLPQERAISLSNLSNPRDLLDRAKSIVSGIIDHVQEVISKSLGGSDEQDDNLGQSDIVDMTMNDLIESMPDLVAGDEVTTAVEGGVYDTLQSAGIPEIQSVSEGDGRVCGRCQSNEDAGSIPLGSTFPSGDACPPFHNRCRCNLTIVGSEE